MLGFVVGEEVLRHRRCQLTVHYFNKDIHRAPADHSLFACFIGGQREVMQLRLPRAHGCLRLGPDFSLDAAAAYCSRYFPVLKEQHFRTALLRTARVA